MTISLPGGMESEVGEIQPFAKNRPQYSKLYRPYVLWLLSETAFVWLATELPKLMSDKVLTTQTDRWSAWEFVVGARTRNSNMQKLGVEAYTPTPNLH